MSQHHHVHTPAVASTTDRQYSAHLFILQLCPSATSWQSGHTFLHAHRLSRAISWQYEQTCLLTCYVPSTATWQPEYACSHIHHVPAALGGSMDIPVLTFAELQCHSTVAPTQASALLPCSSTARWRPAFTCSPTRVSPHHRPVAWAYLLTCLLQLCGHVALTTSMSLYLTRLKSGMWVNVAITPTATHPRPVSWTRKRRVSQGAQTTSRVTRLGRVTWLATLIRWSL